MKNLRTIQKADSVSYLCTIYYIYVLNIKFKLKTITN